MEVHSNCALHRPGSPGLDSCTVVRILLTRSMTTLVRTLPSLTPSCTCKMAIEVCTCGECHANYGGMGPSAAGHLAKHGFSLSHENPVETATSVLRRYLGEFSTKHCQLHAGSLLQLTHVHSSTCFQYVTSSPQ